MKEETGREPGNQDGAEPVYGPGYAQRRDEARNDAAAAGAPARTPLLDGPSPAYTAPYPPYPSDVPYPTPIPVPVAAALAYLVAPAVVFLLLPAYRSHTQVRFHSWQAIFYFFFAVAVREVEQLLVSMLPSAAAFTVGGLLMLAVLAGWLVAAIKALQGEKWLLPVVGRYAEQVSSTTSLQS